MNAPAEDRLEPALRAASMDDSHIYAPAYLEIAAAHVELVANEDGLEENALDKRLAPVRAALLAYRGQDPTVSEVVHEVRQAQAREQAAREHAEQARQEKERQDRYRKQPCQDCGRKALKSDKVCRCGSALDDG